MLHSRLPDTALCRMNKQQILKQAEQSIQYILDKPDESIKALSDTLNVDATDLRRELELLRQAVAERINKPSLIVGIPLLIVPAIAALAMLVYISNRLDNILSDTGKISNDIINKQEVFSDVSAKVVESRQHSEIQIETTADFIGTLASTSYLGLMLIQVYLLRHVISKLENLLQKREEIAPGKMYDTLLIFRLVNSVLKLIALAAFIVAVISFFTMKSGTASLITFVNTLLGSLLAIVERYYESKLQFILDKIQWQMNVRSILRDPLKYIRELREDFKLIKEKIDMPDTIARYLNTIFR